MRKIDCRGLKCPEPTIIAKKYFDSIGEGEAVIVVDNENSNNNIYKYAISKGYQVVSNHISENLYELTIEKRGCLEVLEEDKTIVVVVTSDKLGHGEMELGKILMKEYFMALSADDKQPNKIIFLNSGVKLLKKDSEIIDYIKRLLERGVSVIYSKTCVDYYNIQNEITLGEASNIYDIVECMNECGNLIKI